MYVFFFKQKTAYEMRISDWSSDVCSSDLDASLSLNPFAASRSHILLLERSAAFPSKDCQSPSSGRSRASRSAGRCGRSGPSCAIARVMTATRVFQSGWVRLRSEEHTSELQSLMRISYAVFFLNKKNTQIHTNNIN